MSDGLLSCSASVYLTFPWVIPAPPWNPLADCIRSGVPFQLGCGGPWGAILLYAWVRGSRTRYPIRALVGIPTLKSVWTGGLFPLFQLPDDLYLTSKSGIRPPFLGATGPRGDLCKLATLWASWRVESFKHRFFKFWSSWTKFWPYPLRVLRGARHWGQMWEQPVTGSLSMQWRFEKFFTDIYISFPCP